MPGGVAGAQLLWLPPMPIDLQPNLRLKNGLKPLISKAPGTWSSGKSAFNQKFIHSCLF